VKALHQRIGIGVAAIVAGSALVVAPLAATAAGSNPTRICVDNGPASQCTSLVIPRERAGGSGNEVTVILPASPGRPDAKDHPNYGPVLERPGDAKDHPNYGPVLEGRGDAKDHPNYGPVVQGPGDVKDHPNFR
jgi:hypothetical protein